MLSPNLYWFTNFASSNDKSLIASFQLNPKHAIFAGHFPGQPVVPGVCMLQIIKEALERALNKKLFLTQAATIKFLSMLVPIIGEEINLQADFSILAEGKVTVLNASLSSSKAIFIKLTNAHYLSSSIVA
jgi:3-hydroxyacyl-[acyl-carrier-protein] dehydratase